MKLNGEHATIFVIRNPVSSRYVRHSLQDIEIPYSTVILLLILVLVYWNILVQ
jgi:hypothetical protein